MDRRLLRHANAARAFIGACVVLGAINGLLVIAQAWLIADIVSAAFDGRGVSAATRRADRTAGRRGRTGTGRLGRRGRGRALGAAGQDPAAVGLAVTADARSRRCLGPGDRRGRHARRPGDRRPGRVLLAVSPPASAGRDRPARRRRGAARRRLDLRGHRGGDAAVDPGVHGAGGRDHARSDRGADTHPRAARRAFPGRHLGAAHAQGVRCGQASDAGDRRRRRSPPAGHARDVAHHVPVLADARAAVDDLGGDSGGRGGPAPAGGRSRPSNRAVRAGARARGVSATADAGGQLPRQRRRRQRGGADLRAAGGADTDARAARRHPRSCRPPSSRCRSSRCPTRAGRRRRSTACR